MKITKLFWLLALLLTSGAVVSCSETDEDATVGEFADWQARNDAYFYTLEDSLASNPLVWKKLITYSKAATATNPNTDYIYVKVLVRSDETGSPLYTDTARVAYRGRLIPSATDPEGYVFNKTFVGNFDIHTTDVSNLAVKNYVDGFATALMYMHKGDYWRVYIPYQLGYGSQTKNAIPAYSTLIFDLILIDYVTGTDKLDPWSSRTPW